MPLILAIEPDKRQSSQLAAVVKGLHAELVHRANVTDGLSALQGRVPDLVLTTSLISPKDDAALAAHLRELGSAAAHVQTVSIPLLGAAAVPSRPKIGVLAALRREKPQQAPMTDGCSPEVFADQVRQYLATAEEQKVKASTRLSAVSPEAPAAEAAADQSIAIDDFLMPPEPEPIEPEVPEPFIPLAGPEPEPLIEAATEPVVETVVELDEPEELTISEAEAPPLSQILQLVSEPAPAAPAADESAFVDDTVFADEPMAGPGRAHIPAIAAEWQAEEGWEPEPDAEEQPEPAVLEPSAPRPASDFEDLYVDPMAARALDELSRQTPVSSIADGIPGEPPVPVVEMHRFQSLDSIASELAASPSPRYESLDDLASLFAATPAAAAPPMAPMHGDSSEFASLFAEPTPARTAEPIEVPGIDPSLFASTPSTSPLVYAEPEPMAALTPEPIFVTAPEPIFATAPEPVVAIEPEPVELAPIATARGPVFAEIAEPAVIVEPVKSELSIEEPEMEPVPVAAAPAPGPGPEAEFDEEIALDVDSFTFPPPEEPAETSRFSFTFVDGFGDALSDFEVPPIAAVADDLGVSEQLALDPYVAEPAAAPGEIRLSAEEHATAPALDEEALSLIGDAARKVSLDALVIDEFERGLSAQRPKKPQKKKVHAGANQVPAAPAPAPKPAKRPVQDEWGMFDPEQCGFAALDDEDGDDARPTTGTRVRVISY